MICRQLRRFTVAAGLALVAAIPASAHAATRTIGALTIQADETRAYPGGLLDVRIRARRGLSGVVLAVLDGRRIPAFHAAGELRALVPIPVTHWPGPATLGVEIRTRRGRQRIPVPVTIGERVYPARGAVIPETKRLVLDSQDSVRDGRRVQQLLRTETAEKRWRGPFQPPVDVRPETSFGARRAHESTRQVEALFDAVWGEYHRGLDYPVPSGTVVRAPADGVVLFAGPLTLGGRTLILDHGRGLISVFYHLAATHAREGDRVARGAPVAVSGDSGLAATPHLHWGVYLHTVAIDPRVTLSLD